jgi:hypothetical protein
LLRAADMDTRTTLCLFALALLITVSACGSAHEDAAADPRDADCTAAVEHVRACFPDATVTAPATCDAASAATLRGLDCETLAAGDGKADSSWTCLWAPWLCGGATSGSSGGGSGSGTRLEIAAELCGQGLFDGDCPYVQSLPCTEVVVKRSGAELDRGYTSLGGRRTVEDAEDGQYEVQLLDRRGRVVASTEVEVAGETAWARLTVPAGTEARTQACARVSFDVAVTDQSPSLETEWSWIATFTHADGRTDLGRPFFVHAEASGTGGQALRLAVHEVFPGTHTLSMQRVEIPTSARKNNPDYEALLRRYAAEVEPVEFEIELTKADVPDGTELAIEVADPLAL